MMNVLFCLSHLQGDDGECRQYDGHNPESDGNLGFMEGAVRPALEQISARAVQLTVQSSEGVMYRSGTEHAHAFTFLLLYLKPLRLDDDTQTLHEEDAAEDRQQQFLMADDGAHTDDTTDGE